MPFPFIPVVAVLGSAIAAVFGLETISSAKKKEKLAKRVYYNAKNIIYDSKLQRDSAESRMRNTIQRFGKLRYQTRTETLNRSFQILGRIANIDNDIQQYQSDVLDNYRITPTTYCRIQQTVSSGTAAMAGSAFSGVITGGATAGALYGMVGMLGTASTGTMISSLSGAAATKATLAALGGGSLTAGGLGIAGGMATLGGVAIAPAILVFGKTMDNRATAELERSKAARANAEAFHAQNQVSINLFNAIHSRATALSRTLEKAKATLTEQTHILQKICHRKGTDYRKFNERERQCVLQIFMLLQIVIALVEVPILNKSGCVEKKSALVLATAREKLEPYMV